MANRYWIAGSTANWNDTANWSTSSGGAGGASVPGSSDVANYDANGVGNCRLDASIDVLGIVKTSGYTGTIDGATDNLNHAVGSSGISANGSGGTISWGAGDWTLTAGSILLDGPSLTGSASGKIVVAGTVTSLTMKFKSIGKRVEVTGTVSNATNQYFSSPYLLIKTGASLTTSGNYTLTNTGIGNTIEVESGGTLTLNNTGGCATSVLIQNGTLSGSATITLSATSASTSISGSGVINCPVLLRNATSFQSTWGYVLGSNVVFGSNFTLESINTGSSAGVHFTPSGYDIEFRGDVTVNTRSHPVTWNKGSGTITFSGTADQNVDFEGESVEDFVINKTAGSVTLLNNFTTDSLTFTDGTLDIDGNDITVSGGMTVAAGCVAQDTTTGGLISVGGNFAINGASGNEVTWNGPDLDITGTAAADYASVTNSDASAGTQVTATNSTDNGGNTNWDFGAVAAAVHIIGAGIGGIIGG